MLIEHIRFHRPLLDVRDAGGALIDPPRDQRPVADARPHAAAATPPVVAPAGRDAPSTPPATKQLLDNLMTSMAQSIDELEQRRSHSLDEMRQAVIELSVAIASSIVQATIQADQFNIHELVRQAVAQADDGVTLAIHLNPHDLEMVLASLELRGSPWPRGVEVRLEADPSLARGSCRAEGPDFGWLSTVEQRLADIRETLLEHLGQATVDRRTSEAAQRGFGRVPDRRGAG